MPANKLTPHPNPINVPVLQARRSKRLYPYIIAASTAWKRVFQIIIYITKLNFHKLVGSATSPVNVTRFSSILLLFPSTLEDSPPLVYHTGGRNQLAFCSLNRLIASLFFLTLTLTNHPKSLNRYGASPNLVTQNSAFKICELIPSHFFCGEESASLLGWFIAGVVPRSRKMSIAPQATMFSPYSVIKNPVGVETNFYAAVRPCYVVVFQL
ncbi:hypothetical protein DL95DRAFT_468255 [Leptodontidium sp. 2 PMI_412]|nr:hypothetical protein DL95DRAFT_468255 [Leptodontidium sp. 2 PMI_412]